VKALVYPSYEAKKIERRTFTLHLISQVLNGISFGILLLQDVILKKSLLASDIEVTILIFLTSSSFLFSIYGAEIINRSHNPGRTVIIMGFASRFFLLIIPLFQSPAFFVLCIAAMSYLDSLIKPVWNVVFKHNYSEQKRSSLYSYAFSVYTVSLLAFATLLGFLLDIDYRFYKFFFPLAGIVDIIAYINLSRMMNLRRELHSGSAHKFSGGISGRLLKDILILPVRNMFRIFREDRKFFLFEAYFFIYGASLMMISPVIPVYFVEVLQLEYAPISLAKGMLYFSAMIIFTPFMGKLHGTRNPGKFCAWLFFGLTTYPILLIGLEYFTISGIYPLRPFLYITYFIYGIVMSGITVSWNLSTLHYAPETQIANYQAVHITLTGLRGIFSPFLGYLIMSIFSIQAAFILSAFFFTIAGWLMLKGYRKGEV
jgi:hypothetical protein